MRNTKHFLQSMLLAIALYAIAFTPACNTPKLESGGAYAPVTQDGQATLAPDLTLFTIDSTFKLAYSAIDTAFTLEFENREMLKKFSPQIKKSLDSIRPEAVKVRDEFAKARAAYLLEPTPAGLSALQTVLGKLKQLSFVAQAVIPKTQ